MSPSQQALIFLLDNLVMLATLVVMARFVLQMVRADFYNPISQFVVKATNPVLVPMRKVIPGFGGIDWASIVLMLAIQFVYWFIKLLMLDGVVWPIFTVSLSILEVLRFATYFFMGAMIILAIMSWFVRGYNPYAALLAQITDPLLRPIRRVIPPIGGLDISMIFAFIGIRIFQILVLGYIQQGVWALKGM